MPGAFTDTRMEPGVLMGTERAGSQTERRARCGPHREVTLTASTGNRSVAEAQPHPRLFCSDTQRKLLVLVPF
ncbi:hypothetical protein FQA47_024182 [Oryzias melastigma]|uniref:Uncharacterized protein n=1 Tax=Oryzias melastigma TaxID=30732 RepID=A0A834FRC2_ORYME|nr:hypothetical protein FQA47_024182 [Oryzias melastigma]